MRRTLIALAGAALAGGLLAGCSNQPVRTGHMAMPQAELASTAHWSAMARDTGVQLAPYLRTWVPSGARFYVQGHAGATDFARVFQRTLITELRGRNVTVVPTRAQATHVLVFGTRVTDHPPGMIPALGQSTAISAGLWGIMELAETAPFGAVSTAGSALADIAVAANSGAGLSEITVSVAVLGRDGGEINRQTTYYVSRASARNYPELALPPLYARQGRALPEPPVAHFIVE